MKKLFSPLSIVLFLLCVGGWFAYVKYFKSDVKYRYVTRSVARENLASTISATGTVEPEELVNVGAQVGGMIQSFGNDSNGKVVDYGSPVKAGMVLAQIDDSLYDAEARQSHAQKLQAEAAILSAGAAITQAKAKFEYAKSNLIRAERLQPKGAMSRNDYDNCKAEHDVAFANIAVAEATLAQAKASLAIYQAAADRADRNLGYCTIKSPVDGVIIDRRVSIGQTVVSSMNAPSLFLIAKDLKRMQIWVSVNEADIGDIKPKMLVRFTVDAFPDRIFKGIVHKIRLNATMSQNVVTYVVEVATDNSDGVLLPYLTAGVKFIRAERQNVLSIPNAAFRFTPENAMISPEFRDDGARKPPAGFRTVWIVGEDELLKPHFIRTGLNDGASTEIIEGAEEKMQFVTSGSAAASSEKTTAAAKGSPFIPQRPRRR